ncbi:hypothetical protein NMY22_g14388 [Coprinellus aureogranulatus]|nr:hypothetical protein NMY22_g14388 [Coprinellus aureogranulatus]
MPASTSSTITTIDMLLLLLAVPHDTSTTYPLVTPVWSDDPGFYAEYGAPDSLPERRRAHVATNGLSELDLDDAIDQTQNPRFNHPESKRGRKTRQRKVPCDIPRAMPTGDDYHRSLECQDQVEPVPEGLYLRAFIKPIYLRDQGYEVVDGKFVRREKDYQDIVVYDDVNRPFWYPEGIASIVLNDRNRVFFKTYFKKCSYGHLNVNASWIWVIDIGLYYFYTAYNSPTNRVQGGRDSTVMSWGDTALGGAVATIIIVLATLAEFSYIPITWNNTSHPTRHFLFLLGILGPTGGPTIHSATIESNGTGGDLTLILAIVLFLISVVAALLFAIVTSGRMFGGRVAGKSRKYPAKSDVHSKLCLRSQGQPALAYW